MPTYLQLESEQVWHDQIVPPFMTGFLIVPLRNFYGLDANAVGAPGDNNHLYGRHRSANWDRQSRYCTNRAYGTVDGRDHQGDQNWYRAVDTGIQGQTLFDACHRLDAAVRAGQLPEVAEWFGTFDGHTVVGWYEGHASSSDSSHLYHLHVGFWNQYADDFQVMQRVYGIITGTEGDAMTAQEVWGYPLSNADGQNGNAGEYLGGANQYAYHGGQAAWRAEYLLRGLAAMADPIIIPANDRLDIAQESVPNKLAQALAAGGGGAGLTPEELAQVSGAAHDGAASAIDGAMVSSSVISIKTP